MVLQSSGGAGQEGRAAFRPTQSCGPVTMVYGSTSMPWVVFLNSGEWVHACSISTDLCSPGRRSARRRPIPVPAYIF